jgi:hypothetical protein
MSNRLRGPPLPLVVAKCNRLLRLGPDYVSDDMYERGAPGGALNLNSTGYADHGRYGDLPLQGKIPTAEPGIEPGT